MTKTVKEKKPKYIKIIEMWKGRRNSKFLITTLITYLDFLILSFLGLKSENDRDDHRECNLTAYPTDKI